MSVMHIVATVLRRVAHNTSRYGNFKVGLLIFWVIVVSNAAYLRRYARGNTSQTACQTVRFRGFSFFLIEKLTLPPSVPHIPGVIKFALPRR
jgi:hypothetical protein